MPLYFAYGANMDIDGMAKRVPASRPLGLARLPRHRFVITSDGYASVVRDPRAEVHGMLWELALSDVRALDRFEGVDRGLYSKINQPVITASGPRRALVYVGSGKAGGKPRPGYLEDVLRAAGLAGLPPAYRADMAKWGAGTAAAAVKSARSVATRATDAWSWDG